MSLIAKMAKPEKALISAPAQFSQPSRKGKKAWRKNIDITHVLDGLDSVRDDIIHGGNALHDRESDALFTVDYRGDVHKSLEYRREQRLKKPLKADEILAQRSAVPACDSRKRGDKRIGVINFKHSTRPKSTGGEYVSREKIERLRKIAFSGVHGPRHEVGKPFIHDNENERILDVWENENVNGTEIKCEEFSFIPNVKPIKRPATMNIKPISLLKSGKMAPAVLRPDPGKSYNPLYSDWEKLYCVEADKEVEAENRRIEQEKAQREHNLKIEAYTRQIEEEERENELYCESEWEGIETDREITERESSELKRRNKRKTKSERNREKRRKEIERRNLEERMERIRLNEITRIKQIMKQVNTKHSGKPKQSELSENGKNGDSIDSETEELRRQKLGKIRLGRERLELVLPDEFPDSLRQLRPEGNLIEDRYRRIAMRGKIEVRPRIWQPKKVRRVMKEKWSYKDWKLS